MLPFFESDEDNLLLPSSKKKVDFKNSVKIISFEEEDEEDEADGEHLPKNNLKNGGKSKQNMTHTNY